jgi:hypothetical protein
MKSVGGLLACRVPRLRVEHALDWVLTAKLKERITGPFAPLLITAERLPSPKLPDPAPSPDSEKLDQHVGASAPEILKEVIRGEVAHLPILHPRVPLNTK